MSVTTFPRTGKKTLGYSAAQVEEFLAVARKAYDAGEDRAEMTDEDIRHTAFSMHRGGYSPAHVDAALERLEDAFATRDRDRAAQSQGTEAWLAEVHALAQVLVNRLSRSDGHRFHRVSILSVGYNRADVDRFSESLVRYFEDGLPVTVDDVRCAVVRPQRGGYRESQVDVVLDSVVDVILAVR